MFYGGLMGFHGGSMRFHGGLMILCWFNGI